MHGISLEKIKQDDLKFSGFFENNNRFIKHRKCNIFNAILYTLNSLDYKERLMVVINHEKMQFCYILYVKINLLFSLNNCILFFYKC